MRRRDLLAATLAVTGCAPMRVQTAGSPGAGFAGPRLDADALVSFDGARLPLKVWTAASGDPWAVIVGLHGMNDHADEFRLPASYWAERGVTTYAFDQRGFGAAADRGVWGGEALMRRDLVTACALVRARHPGRVLAVAGISMGGAVAITASASDEPPDCDRLVLASPAVWGWGAQPWPSAAALWTLAHVAPGAKLEAPNWLAARIKASDNIEELRRMGRDREMIFATRADATYGLVQLMEQARRRIGQMRDPARTIYLYGAHDDLIPKPAAFFAAHALAKAGGRTAYYDTGYHLLTRDLHRTRVLDDVLAALRDPAAPLPSGAPPIPERG